jgi:multidrug efflux pump subunit AcrB
MKDKMSIIEKAMRSKQIVFTITAALLLFGIFALFNMPRQEFPTFTIRQGLVIGVFPGATSAQVEDQLTAKVENYLYQYNQVDRKKTYSISKEGMMIIFVELTENVTDPEAFWSKLRHGLNELKGQLPPEVLALIADNDFGDTSALLLSIESDTKTYKQLEDYMDSFENEVRKVETVSKIKHFGLQKEQISVYIDDAKLTHYGIKPLTVLLSLKPENSVAYAGELDNGKIIMPLHVPMRYKTENDVAQQIIYSDPLGHVIRVKDVAKVVREYAEPDSYIRLNGKKCLIVSLEMQNGNNIVQFGEDLDKVIYKFSKNLPSDVKINKIANMPEVVDHAISNFLKEFLLAIISVILVTIVLLPKRVAFVAASSIPISVLITLGILYAVGIDLQTVSLAGLIVVLGMVVDNAIVIIDNYVEKLDHGMSPWEAAWRSVKDLFISVFTATLAIIATYVPFMFFLKGTTKDFAWSLPVTVGIALMVSLIVAAVLIPILSSRFIKHGINAHRKDDKPTFLDRLQALYDSILEKSFKRQKLVLIIGVLSVVIGGAIAMFLPRQLFPKVERNQFAVEIYLPTGSSLDQTEKVVKDVENKLLSDSRVKTVASFVGASSPRFHTVYAPNMPSKNYAQMIVNTETDKDANAILDEYSRKFSDYYPEAYIRWKQLDMLSSKAPIEVRLSGDSINVLKESAAKVADIMRRYDGITWVRYDYEEPRQGVSIDIRQDVANRLGYSKSFLAYSLAIGTGGFPVSTIWEGDYPVNVVLKVDKKKKTSYEDIKNQYVASPFMITSTPVRQLAELKPDWT